MLPDLKHLSKQQRKALAWRVHEMKDFALPRLRYFNDQPCQKHVDLAAGREDQCRKCGISFYSHQRVGIAWLYMNTHGLLADETGLGKSAHIAGLIAAMKETGELTVRNRVVLVARAASVRQWARELPRMIPEIPMIVANRPRQKRVEDYLSGWEVCLISDRTLVNDYDMLFQLGVGCTIGDDIDPLRNRETRAAHAFKKLAQYCSRVVVVNATPMQKRLPELYSTLEPLGGRELLGTERQFTNKHIRTGLGSSGRKEVTGYMKIGELKDKIAPLVLRRTAADVDDVEMPEIMPPNNIYLDLLPDQRATYEQLKRGILEIIKQDGGTSITYAKAQAAWLYGQMVCSGLPALGFADGPGASVKLDWLERFAEDSEEKIVAFVGFKGNVAALEQRLMNRGIGFASITGDVKKDARDLAQERLFDDPHCKVLIGTQAIEMSLNLQAARHLVNVDTIQNPARMTQVAGRIKRVGSRFKTLYVHNLFAAQTQEENYLDRLRKEQEITNAVWDGRSELYEALSPLERMQLILS